MPRRETRRRCSSSATRPRARRAGRRCRRATTASRGCCRVSPRAAARSACAAPVWTRGASKTPSSRRAANGAAWPGLQTGPPGPTRRWCSERAMSRSVLILGAGLGGVVAAEALRKLLPAEDRVTVVDRAESHLFPPSLLWLMVGTRAAGDFSRPIARLAGRGIEVLRGEVTRIDPQAVAAEIDAKKISADAMVIALGAAYAPEAIPGLAEAGLSFYTLEGAAAIHAELEKFSGGRLVVLTAAPQYKCPAGPYEAALLAEDFLARKGVRGSTEIDFYAAEPAPMVVAGPEMGRAVRGLIEGRGGSAGMGSGDFYAEPLPRITVRSPSVLWHAGKVLYEKYWLWSRF